MKKITIVLLIGLFLCSGYASAELIGSYDVDPSSTSATIEPNMGAAEFVFNGFSNFTLEPGSSFDINDTSTVYQFRYDWVSSVPLDGGPNFGSIYWRGSVDANGFFFNSGITDVVFEIGNGDYVSTLENEFSSTSDWWYQEDYPDESNIHIVFYDANQLPYQPTMSPGKVNLALAEIHVVPIPGAVWLLCSGIIGWLGSRKILKK